MKATKLSSQRNTGAPTTLLVSNGGAMVMQIIDVKPVRSKDLALVGYDHATSTLEVVFRAGGVYRYQQVPESVYHELMAAPSHGTHFQKHVKTKYPFEKIS